MPREQDSICNREQMVTTGDRAGPGAGSQLEISMTFIFIFPYVAIGSVENENLGREGVLLYVVTSCLDVDLVPMWDNFPLTPSPVSQVDEPVCVWKCALQVMVVQLSLKPVEITKHPSLRVSLS